LAKGDHIRVRRWRGIYSHHGIDIGDGTVVHFSGEPMNVAKAEVVRESIEAFLQGGECKTVRYERDVLHAEETVDRALEQVGVKGYRLWTNNCEHFAAYCKTGEKHSHQVRRAARRLATVGASAVLVAGTLVLSRVRGRSGQRA